MMLSTLADFVVRFYFFCEVKVRLSLFHRPILTFRVSTNSETVTAAAFASHELSAWILVLRQCQKLIIGGAFTSPQTLLSAFGALVLLHSVSELYCLRLIITPNQSSSYAARQCVLR